MKIENRKSVMSKLNRFDCLADKEDFIEVTSWSNSEGYDITISGKHKDKIVSFTDGELEAIHYLVMSVQFPAEEE